MNIDASFVKKNLGLGHENLINIEVFYNLFKDAYQVLDMAFRMNYKRNRMSFFLWKRTVLSSIRTVINKVIVQNSYNNQIIVIEPSYLMLFLNGCMHRKQVLSKKKLEKFVNKFNYMDVLVSISVDPDNSLKRMLLRERGEPIRMQPYSKEEKRRIINLGNMYSKKIVEICRKKMIVIEINGNNPTEDSIQKIVKHIKGTYEEY